MGINCYRGGHRLLYHKFYEDMPLHMIWSYKSSTSNIFTVHIRN